MWLVSQANTLQLSSGWVLAEFGNFDIKTKMHQYNILSKQKVRFGVTARISILFANPNRLRM